MPKFSSLLGKQNTYSRYRKNIMSPLNIFFPLIGAPFFGWGVVYSDKTWVNIFSCILVALIILFYLSVYLYALIKCPSRLQTEGANLEEKALNYLLPNSETDTPIRADQQDSTLIKVESNNVHNCQNKKPSS
ncbi:MAG: hypothetical protein Tsb0015_03210 [Simkaniaceae bacterium]